MISGSSKRAQERRTSRRSARVHCEDASALSRLRNEGLQHNGAHVTQQHRRVQVWYTSDLHIGHRLVAGQQGLGAADNYEVKYLIAGNHDGMHPMHADSHKLLPTYLEVFASVQQSARRKLAGHTLLLSHFPYVHAGLGHHVESDNSFDQWRLPDMGAWLLHGHTRDSIRLRAKSIHVGVDAWVLAPVSIGTIAALIMQNALTGGGVREVEAGAAVHEADSEHRGTVSEAAHTISGESDLNRWLA